MRRHRRSFDVVYATGAPVEAWLGARLARRPLALKFVGDPAWERGSRRGFTALEFEQFQSSRTGGLRLRAMRLLRNRPARAADAVIVPSHHLARAVEGWGARRVKVIPNAVRVPADLVTPRPPSPVTWSDLDNLRVITVSRLVAVKRIDKLIDAAVLSGVELEIVGEGPEHAALADRVAASSGGANVRLTGPASHHEVLERIAHADVFALASDHEGLPHVVIEALAVGTPVVSAPVGGVPEVITDGRDGVLVDPPTVEGFAAELASLRSDPSRRRALAAGAAESGLRWQFDRCADDIEKLLQTIVRGTGDPRPGVVFVGKTTIDRHPGAELRRKFSLHSEHLRQVTVAVGPAGSRTIEGVRVVALPSLRPRILGGLVFYIVGPVLATTIAARRRSAIVCQSPFEAVGVLLARRLIPRRRRPAVQIELHGDWRTASRLYGHPARRVLAPISDRAGAWALVRADRVRTISDHLEARCRDVGYRGPIDRFIAFTDYGAFLDRPTVAIPDRPHVLFAGAFERTKAVDVLLDAWPGVVGRQPDATLTCVGAGSMSDRLRSRGREPQLRASVQFRSPVTSDELAALMDESTCLVLPSRSEGLGRVLMEAMARGRPVVASNVGGVPEVVDDGLNGRLVPPDDAVALADALVDVLHDRPRAVEMGAAARAVAETRSPSTDYEAGIVRLATWITERAACPPS
jgi:glycosyltransferase involved in cell wall biosynthesis